MDSNLPQPNNPFGKPSIWVNNPHLRVLLVVLIFVFLFSGMGLVALMQVQNNYRQKIYEETEAGLPKHIPIVLKSYTSTSTGVSFSYPGSIAVNETDGIITLNHQIAFENHGDCSMKGDTKTYPKLNDFNVGIRVLDGTVAQAVKQLSPYMPAENYSGDTLKMNPGFIDAVKIGRFTGFGIYEGVEGCGHVIYYFPVEGNRTLVVTKDLVEQLSAIVTPEVRNAVLAVPGVITPEQSDALFKQIINNLKITQPTAGAEDYTVTDSSAKPGWKIFSGHTIYGPETKFSIEYPSAWTFTSSRGAGAVKKGECVVAFGAGGHGLEGAKPVKNVEVNTVGGLTGTVTLNDFGGSWEAFVNFQSEYIFEFSSSPNSNACFNDYVDMVKTVRIY